MNFPVMKSAGFVLVNAPDMVINAGSTFTTERILNPESDLLKNGKDHLRSFEDFINYLPNQIYIGNEKPEKLGDYKLPYCEIDYKNGRIQGRHGSIVSESEFIAVMKYCDEFDLVMLSEEYVSKFKEAAESRFPELKSRFSRLVSSDISKADELIKNAKAMGIYIEDKLMGYVRQAHDTDVNLNAHTVFENIVSKASGVLAAIETLKHSSISKDEIEYVIECSEEACGDMNQRGGGNFAKAIAEVAGIENATGSDVRSFCAAPMHAIMQASALVQAGIYENVMVVAGGSTAKLGMNARDHIKKGLPILEDGIAGFGVIISKNDGVSPILRTDIIGRHTVKTGSSPQAVISSLVSEPLNKNGLKISDVDKFAPELQNPDITKPAGAGDVPESNYKMIAALAVMQGEIERKDLKDFVLEKGLPGWAPTQGHIPSAAPYCGHMIEDLTEGNLNRVMLVGKGSLFLGRMTNLFDGVSMVVERNTGEVALESVNEDEQVRRIIAEVMKKVAQGILDEKE
ncbi:MAG: glycine reductase [Tissierellia bacterium]|nr:glycine reductase [Tissierellia bacterium]